MCLELDAVLPYLIERGLVDATEVVEYGLTVREISRRNANFSVQRNSRRGYIIKQAADAPDSACTLRTEAEVYSFIQRDARGNRLRDLFPTLEHYFPSEGLLILNLVDGARPLSEVVHSLAPLPSELGPLIGQALGRLHASLRVSDFPGDRFLECARYGPPWVLLAHKPGPELLATMTSATARLLRVTQGQNELCIRLERLRRQWRCTALVHGDIRADNMLVVGDNNGGSHVMLVDWELAHFGDPAWDVGCAFADWINHWVWSMTSGKNLSSVEMAQSATFPLHIAQAAAGGLWIGYVQAAGLDGEAAQDNLLRALSYCGARLVQSAYESANNTSDLANHAVLLLQVAANVLAAPQAAATDLLDISI